MEDAKFENNMLFIGNQKIIFNSNIYQVLCENQKIFILLDIPPKKFLSYDDYHNVFCYDGSGKRIWQVGERNKGDDSVYTMITLSNSQLYLNDFLGRRYKVNKDTGCICEVAITK